MEDLAILELFRKRSEEAIKEAQKKYADYCYIISYGILQNEEDAEECVNDTFLQAWNPIPIKISLSDSWYLVKSSGQILEER